MTRACNGAVVGVIIEGGAGDLYAGDAGRFLFIKRKECPWGWAPVAGHVDDHGSPLDALYAETEEEAGITLVDPRLIVNAHRPNVCSRPGGERGHYWYIFRARATGEVNPGHRKSRDWLWLAPLEIENLVRRTLAFAMGEITPAEFKDNPGLEPVWAYWLNQTGIVTLSAADLGAIDVLSWAPERE